VKPYKIGEYGGMKMKRLINFTDEDRERYAQIWNYVHEHIDEKTKRLLAASMSLSLGYGGGKVIREITGLNTDTIKLGIEQITGKTLLDDNRKRREGGGRKPITDIYDSGVKTQEVKKEVTISSRYGII